ncbi:MAG: MnhB domain-containing protein [Acidimicrobiales bacterium]
MSPFAHREPTLLEDQPRHRRGVGIVLVGSLGAVLAAALWNLPREHAALSKVARQALDVAIPHWHTLEPVNEVVYGSRAFDTFGETFLLLAAVIGIGLLARSREPRRGFVGEARAGAREQREDDPSAAHGREQLEADQAELAEQGRLRGPKVPDRQPLGSAFPERAEGMTVIVRGIVRVVAPLLAVIGLYVVAWGYSPGGGFPAGAVMLGIVLLAYVAFGHRMIDKIIRPEIIEPLEMAGALLFVVLGLLGLCIAGSFLTNVLPLGQLQSIPSGGLLQAISVSELIEVSTGLTLAVFALLAMTHDWTPDGDEGSEPPSGRHSRPSR